MRLNIYGVGRSGTKALQLMVTYALADRHRSSVKLNYEPYFWESRSVKKISREGIKLNFGEPQVMTSKQQMSKNHIKYLRKLVDHDVVVTKFIRGNGRLAAINEVMNPDFSILVIRNLYEILQSMLQMDWNFYSVGYRFYKGQYMDLWKRFMKELRQIKPELKYLDFASELRRNDVIYRNAFYWYYMNLLAIENADDKVMFLSYPELFELNSVIEEEHPLAFLRDYNIRDFDGEQIHSNHFLESASDEGKGNLFQKHLRNKKDDEIGLVRLSGNPAAVAPRPDSVKVKIESNEIFTALNEEVFELLKNRSLSLPKNPDNKRI